MTAHANWIAVALTEHVGVGRAAGFHSPFRCRAARDADVDIHRFCLPSCLNKLGAEGASRR